MVMYFQYDILLIFDLGLIYHLFFVLFMENLVFKNQNGFKLNIFYLKLFDKKF